jgi:THO complex subunit 2
MAQGPGKRKRGDRTYSQDSFNDSSRPSPHRPNNLSLAQQNQANSSYAHPRDSPGRGGRRGSRGSRALNSPSTPTHQQRQAQANAAQAFGSPSVPVITPPRFDQPADITAPESKTSGIMAGQPSEVTNKPGGHFPRWYGKLTDEIVQSWKSTGKEEIISVGHKSKEEDIIALGCLYQEIIFSGLSHRIDPAEAGDVVKRIIYSDPTDDESFDQDAAESFLDTMAVCAAQESKNLDLRAILLATNIPAELIALILDSEMLTALKLVRPNWQQKEIRHQTDVLYRQANFNLLREETEGYSKLVTELFATVENEPPTNEVAIGAFERVKAMIGSFNLDVGRVLDVTMDVFAAVLVKHNRFFVKFLRASTWWPQQTGSTARAPTELALDPLPKWVSSPNHAHIPLTFEERAAVADIRHERDSRFWTRVKEVGLKAYFELGARRADLTSLDSVLPLMSVEVEKTKNAKGHEIEKIIVPKSNLIRDWIEKTGTLPPQGNEEAAQILGFKLRFYSSAARDADDSLPSNLIYLAALLIKVGFVSIVDLYPHLWPSDDAMDEVKKEKLKEKEERDRNRKPGGKNALELAGALSDDTLPPPPARKTADTSNTTTTPKPGSDDKAENTTEDKNIKEFKQDLPEPADQKIQLLKSLLCIGAIPEALYILGRFPWLVDLVPDLPEFIHRILHHSLSLVYEPLRPLKDHEAVREPAKWASTELNGPKGGVVLNTLPARKVLRWAQLDRMDTNDGTDYRFYWEDWADNVPVCQSVDDVFLLCNTFLNLSGLKIGQDPALLAKLARIGLHSLDIDPSESNKARWIGLCKRLLVPALSFAAHNSGSVAEVWLLLKRFPTVTRYEFYFEWYTGQISRIPDVDSNFKITQSQTRDVLKRISKTNTRTMARSLAKAAVSSPGKVFEVAIKQIESYDNLIDVIVEASRYFTDLGYDVLTWSLINSLGKARSRVQHDGMLTSKWLSALALFCGTVFKRYAVMNPTPVLQYVTNQVLNHNSTDLVVLENLIHSMAGIVFDATFNDNQVIAMCGGPFLRSYTMGQLLDRRQDPTMKASSKRLIKALTGSKLAGVLLVAIAQERQACIYSIDEVDAHLKLLGNLFDEIHRVLTQYLDLLHTNLPAKDFIALIPSIPRLIGEFGIEPAIAFWIWRPFIIDEITAYDKTISERPLLEITNESTTKEATNAAETNKDVEMTDVDAKVDENGESGDNTKPVSKPASENQISHPIMLKLADSVRPSLPTTAFDIISETFYFTFWRLSPYDLHIPETYQEESKRLTSKIEQYKADRNDGNGASARAKEQQRKHLTETNSKMASELKEHLTAYQKTKAILGKEKDTWFENSWGRWDELNLALLEHCFIPRMLLSAVDAFFVFKMLKVLHSMGAKNFRTIAILDCLFSSKRLTPLFFMCTAKEAEHVGRFFNEILKDLGKWHSNKDLYEKEAFGAKKDLPGFKRNLSNPDSFLDHESFRTLLSKWHKNLHDALRDCFKSTEYMHIRNSIIILKAVVLNFPVVDWMGRGLATCLNDVGQKEKRDDLKLAAASLLGNLKRREKQWVTAPVFARVS